MIAYDQQRSTSWNYKLINVKLLLFFNGMNHNKIIEKDTIEAL